MRNNDAVMITCVLCHSSSFAKILIYIQHHALSCQYLDEYENLSLKILGDNTLMPSLCAQLVVYELFV